MLELNALYRYWHTLKYLHPIQYYRRIWFRLFRPKPNFKPAPVLRTNSAQWQGNAQRNPSMTGTASFIFLGMSGSLQNEGWDDPAMPKLWRYNQHYFDDLNSKGANKRREWHHALIARWIDENPAGYGSGWEPYPVSLRLVNWVKFAISGETLSKEAVHSLAVQARWLAKRLEWHLLGNHLFVNAKALMFAGLFFEGREAENWRCIAARILIKELPEQILPDGGQFELSPMYHALALEDLLDMVNLWTAYKHTLSPHEKALLVSCRETIPRMRQWLAIMSHPDGKIAFFNDAAFDIAPPIAELDALAKRLDFSPIPTLSNSASTHLKDSGYVRFESATAVLIADIAAIGPDYLPGHAHADTLSFELSIFGHRVIVNSGTSEYGIGAERNRQRGSAAHSTVTVAGENSSEVWAGFRVARRARVRSVKHSKKRLEATHDGYRRLSPPTDHYRSWQVEPNKLVVTDRICEEQIGKALFHLHPDIRIENTTQNRGTLLMANGCKIHFESTSREIEVQEGTWHPNFGRSIANKCLVFPLENGTHTLKLKWDKQ